MGANGIIYCNPYNNFVMNYFIDTNWCCGNSTILYLIHWDRVTHIRLGKLTTMGWANGLSPGRRQTIVSTNAGIMLTEPLVTNFSEILSEIHAFSFRKMHSKMSSAKWRPFCLCLNASFTATKSHNSFGSKQTTLQQIHSASHKTYEWFHCVCLLNSSSSTYKGYLLPYVCIYI